MSTQVTITVNKVRNPSPVFQVVIREATVIGVVRAIIESTDMPKLQRLVRAMLKKEGWHHEGRISWAVQPPHMPFRENGHVGGCTSARKHPCET